MATKLLHIDRTETSPQIDMDLEQGTLEFVGRSLACRTPNSSSAGCYRWLDEYLRSSARGDHGGHPKLDYLDTSSSKHFYNGSSTGCNAVNERGVSACR
jgi:hypothetical protein